VIRVTIGCLFLFLCSLVYSVGQEVRVQTLPTTKPAEPSSGQVERAVGAPLDSYYDARERVCANRTFEWLRESVYTYHKDSAETGDPAPSIVLTGSWWIARTPELMRVDVFLETPLITTEGISGKGSPLHASVFYWGKTGEIVLYAGRDTDGKVSGGALYQPGSNGFGLPILPLSAIPANLVFLAGVSPLRLMGSEPTDWKLLEVTENEWVFERVPDAQARARTEGWLRFDRMEVRLSRKHDDAPARLEIVRGNSVEKWETLEYTQVENAWMPSKVRCESRIGSSEFQIVYRLQRHARSGNVIVDIPKGTPILDWRGRGRGYWTASLHEIALRVDIPPEVGSDVNREAQGSGGALSQPLTEWSPLLEQSIRQSLQEMERRRRQGAR
jgi:hypothetical protein